METKEQLIEKLKIANRMLDAGDKEIKRLQVMRISTADAVKARHNEEMIKLLDNHNRTNEAVIMFLINREIA